MALPADGVSLQDKRETIESLLRKGASIHELNAVRKHISAIKGGGLAVATPGRVLTLAISSGSNGAACRTSSAREGHL